MTGRRAPQIGRCCASRSAIALVAALAARAGAADPPVLTLLNDKNDFIAHFEAELRVARTIADRIPRTGPYYPYYIRNDIPVNSASFFLPVVEATSWSTPDPARTTAQLWLPGGVITDRFTILPAVPGRSLYLEISLPPFTTGAPDRVEYYNLLRAVSETFHRCHETRYDERRANEIPWPTGDLPPELAAWLSREPFIEPAHPDIQTLVREWLGGRARALPPAETAKLLTARVLEHIQPSGYVTDTNLRFSQKGFTAQRAETTARERRGSPIDLAVLLTAALRAADIPARLVLGFDERISREQGMTDFRAWVEFALYDPRDQRTEWIPIDIRRQREFSSKAPPLHQSWEYFGNNRFLDDAVPLAHHLVPPYDAIDGARPWRFDTGAMFGLDIIPAEAGYLEPELRIWAIGAPIRGGN